MPTLHPGESPVVIPAKAGIQESGKRKNRKIARSAVSDSLDRASRAMDAMPGNDLCSRMAIACRSRHALTCFRTAARSRE
jgi:hypothetical protein